MILKIFCIRVLWLTVSYAADKSGNHAILVAILDVLSEVPRSEAGLLFD